MSVSASVKLNLNWTDTSTDTYVKSSNASRGWDGGDINLTLNSTSTPDAENGATVLVTMSGGAATIDLTSLTHRDGDTRSLAGKKIRSILFYAPTANTGNIVVTKGASNGHCPVGTTFTVPIPPGGAFQWYVVSAGADVTNSSNDTLDISGTGSETLLMKVIWG